MSRVKGGIGVDELSRRLVAVLDSIHEGVEVCDENGIVLYVNPAFGRISGVEPEQRLGKDIRKLVPGGLLTTVLRTHRPLLGVYSRPKGSEVDVLCNAVPIFQDGALKGGALVFQDVSQLLRLTDQLAASTARAQTLGEHLGEVARAKYTFANLVGPSRSLREAVEMARMASSSDSTVLLLGESGVGKELFAHAIHNESRRAGRPFVKVNCAAIPEHLLESEFFGHEKGAFTGASRRKPGMFEVANQGTIFLDEIGDLTPALQGKLLRVLQEREFLRVGGTDPLRVDVRVIAATNRNLVRMVQDGQFREDLYYRLNVVAVTIPPLRERKEDVGPLVEALVHKLNRKLGRRVRCVAPEVMQTLIAHDWPGNVRELENALERAMNLVPADADELPLRLFRHLGTGPSLKAGAPAVAGELCSLEEMEREMIVRALQTYGSTWEGKRRAAGALNISLATLYNKMKKYNVDPAS